MSDDMKIVFMGTPDFSVPCLKALIEDGNEIKGVFTQPDKPRGRRGNQLLPSPVKAFAQENDIKVYQPATLRNGEAMEIIKELEPEMIVVVAYGKILPKEILDYPKYGCVNIHASLLPEYRGAAPIQQVLLDGRDKTGVTAMLMDVGLDTGDMLMRAETPVDENETIDELHDRLSQMGAELIVKVVHDAEKGLLVREKQDDSRSSYVGMLTKDMMKMDFSRPAKELHDLVRALSGTAFLDGKRVKIYRTLVRENKGEAGKILSLNPFIVACGEDSLEIIEIQPEGKKRMSAKDFANGLKNTGTKDLKFS